MHTYKQLPNGDFVIIFVSGSNEIEIERFKQDYRNTEDELASKCRKWVNYLNGGSK